LLGEAASARFASEARNPAAVSGSCVGTILDIEESVSDEVLGTLWPRAVLGAKLKVRDVLDWSARPLHMPEQASDMPPRMLEMVLGEAIEGRIRTASSLDPSAYGQVSRKLRTTMATTRR
jgi:hypothetical protein